MWWFRIIGTSAPEKTFFRGPSLHANPASRNSAILPRLKLIDEVLTFRRRLVSPHLAYPAFPVPVSMAHRHSIWRRPSRVHEMMRHLARMADAYKDYSSPTNAHKFYGAVAKKDRNLGTGKQGSATTPCDHLPEMVAGVNASPRDSNTPVRALLNAGVLDKTSDGRIEFRFDAVRVDFTLRAA